VGSVRRDQNMVIWAKIARAFALNAEASRTGEK
jgi:hypothetical protein